MKALKWIWLAQKCGQASSELLTLIERNESIDAIYGADYEQYQNCGISERLSQLLCDKSLEEARRIVTYCQRAGVGVVCYDDDEFPSALRSLKNPPAVLYYIGRLPDFNKRLCVAIVGTRKMSEYGMKAAYKIAYEVASSGAIVVSGLALGIDGIASCAAVESGGTTVGVLGCGIDVVYPKEHSTLFNIVRQNGAIITEYPPATEPKAINFPIRNRIISGLCQGTAVIDADKSSGAMITAKNAIMQGRDIYAVPGNIDADNTAGTNILIRDGAQAVLSGADIVKNYAYMYRSTLDIQKMNNSESHSDFNADAVSRMGVSVSYASSLGRKTQEKKEQSYPSFGRKPVQKTNNAEQKLNKPHPWYGEMPSAEKSKAPLKEGKEVKREARAGDSSKEALAKLNEKQRRIFEEMPIDKAVTVDYLTKTGFTLGEVISALTVLEIKGLISSLPGALYIRK